MNDRKRFTDTITHWRQGHTADTGPYQVLREDAPQFVTRLEYDRDTKALEQVLEALLKWQDRFIWTAKVLGALFTGLTVVIGLWEGLHHA